MKEQLLLSGGTIEDDTAMKASEINHLRRLLAWMRCEYMLDEDFQNGHKEGALLTVEHGMQTEDEARKMLAARNEEINRVPKYIRDGVKALTKKIRAHDAGIAEGVTVSGSSGENSLIMKFISSE